MQKKVNCGFIWKSGHPCLRRVSENKQESTDKKRKSMQDGRNDKFKGVELRHNVAYLKGTKPSRGWCAYSVVRDKSGKGSEKLSWTCTPSHAIPDA